MSNSEALPVAVGLVVEIAFVVSFASFFSNSSIPVVSSRRSDSAAEVTPEIIIPDLTVTMDRSAIVNQSYVNNKEPLVYSHIAETILNPGQKVSIKVYYPNGTLYREEQADVNRDGYYGLRIPMDVAFSVAGRYAIHVTYGIDNNSSGSNSSSSSNDHYVAETSFDHVVEYNQDPEGTIIDVTIEEDNNADDVDSAHSHTPTLTFDNEIELELDDTE